MSLTKVKLYEPGLQALCAQRGFLAWEMWPISEKGTYKISISRKGMRDAVQDFTEEQMSSGLILWLNQLASEMKDAP